MTPNSLIHAIAAVQSLLKEILDQEATDFANHLTLWERSLEKGQRGPYPEYVTSQEVPTLRKLLELLLEAEELTLESALRRIKPPPGVEVPPAFRKAGELYLRAMCQVSTEELLQSAIRSVGERPYTSSQKEVASILERLMRQEVKEDKALLFARQIREAIHIREKELLLEEHILEQEAWATLKSEGQLPEGPNTKLARLRVELRALSTIRATMLRLRYLLEEDCVRDLGAENLQTSTSFLRLYPSLPGATVEGLLHKAFERTSFPKHCEESLLPVLQRYLRGNP